MKRKKRYFRQIARILFLTMAAELVMPAVQVYALTGGPSQPEVQSFEPVGTTDMVDQFSGDFVYNIPLLDAGGYPINISYHSGIGIEDEASWVGLGWNINPGVINRSVRGVPDDFKGDQLYKLLKMKKEKEYRMNMGVNLEFVGFDLLKLNLGYFVSYNNYKGIGMGFYSNINFTFPSVSTGLGFSVSSLDGADVDVSAGLTFASGKASNGAVNSIGLSAGTGFNSRSGLKALTYGLSLTQSASKTNEKTGRKVKETGGLSFGGYVPIGLENYVISQTNKTTFNAFDFSVKFGSELAFLYPHFGLSLYGSTLEYDDNGSKPTYGFLYLQDADEKSLMDFSREKDGIYNATLPNLPLSNMTYDLYSVSGHGTGGMFRPFRNDIGTVFDPEIKSSSTSVTAGAEAGMGNGFEIGANVSYYTNKVESGPLKRVPFKQRTSGSLFENFYFKQAGEMTYSISQLLGTIANHSPVNVNGNMGMYDRNNQFLGNMPEGYDAGTNNFPRTARANNISFFTNEQLATHSTNSPAQIKSFPKNSFYDNNGTISNINRYETNNNIDKARKHQMAEITQLLPDGRQYIYGIPAMNNIQKEVTFKVPAPDQGSMPYQTGLIGYTQGGYNEDYYQTTVTPAFAHSYLLTAVLSEDYVDITGDGPTEDDLGEYTKINYTRTTGDYRWRSPYSTNADQAQFSPGFYSDITDDKASYIIGSKEIWHVHSIETKNYIAEFTLSEREDGKGVMSAVIDNNDKCSNVVTAALKNTGNAADQKLYKLDNIKLYSKMDRYLNKQNAVPIKSVFFSYDYSLCKGIPNSSNPATVGKLTLKKIAFKNGNSDISLLNPYEFTYNHNPNYDFIAKDRWGNYKPNSPDFSNHENPYVKQNKTEADLNASAWLLSSIKLPSGGEMNVAYESDDYSYVQDKEATEMIKIAGVGSGENFDPKKELYEGNNDVINDYIYFPIDNGRIKSNLSIAENYFRDNKDKLLYFSVNLDISGRNRYEPIKGYAKVEKIEKCPNNSQYGYIKLKREKMGKNTNKLMHPITLCALNIGRYYLGQVIYPGSTVQYDNGSNKEVINGLKGAMDEMMSLGQNVNARFMERGLARTININKSMIRLSSPGYTKLGGGTRVKSLTISDKWNSMVANGANSVTGKYYDYTTEHPLTGIKMSSGVASYEPMIGGDENPLRMPINYTGDAGRLLPPVELFQEGPLGESFYPGASVGYSKITVTSMHKNEARSSKAIDVTEYYTAKDFPIYIDYTPIRTDVKYNQNNLLYRVEKIGLSQGYALCMNDMHGKLKSITNYVLKDEDVTKRELIASVLYNYKTDAKGKLDNKVKAVLRKKVNTRCPEYMIQDNFVLGEEVDYTVDNRMRYTSSMTTSVNANVNLAVFGIIPICIPAVFTPPRTEERTFQTSTATKIIQQYGILSSVEKTDHGAKTIVHNTLYDGETGQVLVTKTTNDYRDPVSNISMPAHWMHYPMGGAYTNIGYEEIMDSLNVNSDLDGILYGMDDKSRFQVGDELLMTAKNASGNIVYNQRVWVSRLGFVNDGVNWVFALTVQPRAKNPAGNSTTWLPQYSSYKNVVVKVLRSGNRNQLGHVMQEATYVGTMPYNVFTDLFAEPTKVISASAATYTNNYLLTGDRINRYNGFPLDADAPYKYNQFIKGLKGAYKPNGVYSFLTDRKYTDGHSRTDGTYANFTWANHYTVVAGDGCYECASCRTFDYAFQNTWQLLKSMYYDVSGNQIGEQDPTNKWSSVLYGYQNQLPVAVAENASYDKIQYLSFDDLFMLYHQNSNHLGQMAMFKARDPLNILYNSNGNAYGTYIYPPSTQISNNMYTIVQDAHTGKYALKASSATYNVPVSLYYTTGGNINPEMYFSIWVKPPSGTVDASLVKVMGSTPFTAVTKSIEGWYKLECKANVAYNAAVFIQIPANYIIDDVRVHPERANMKSFVYDPVTLRLQAQLDENNFATFYEYDAEGKLVRTKKETEKGILTLSESRMSTKK